MSGPTRSTRRTSSSTTRRSPDPASVEAFATTRAGTPIAAWLLKANPDVWDVVGALRAAGRIDGWRLQRGYRTDLVSPGQRCYLWVTGTRAGVWAGGTITTAPVNDRGDPDDRRWRDATARSQRRPYVGVALTAIEPPLDKAELAADARFVEAEILRLPRMGNPLVLTPAEVAAIEERR